MKLASVDLGDGPTVAVESADGGLIDLASLDRHLPRDMRKLLEEGPQALAGLARRAASLPGQVEPEAARFLPVVPEPHAIWCLALNYRPHIEEGGFETPGHPALFLRVAQSLCGHREPILRPVASDRLDYEGELAVIIGAHARHVPARRAREVVAGYSCFNEGSVRDWQHHTQQITPGKCFQQTGPFGPWLTTADEAGDIERATLTTTVNGELRQRATIDELLFGIDELIAYVSTMCDLRPGDVIVTGTPGGTGARQDPPAFLRSGDLVEVEIEGVGRLCNPVAEEMDAIATDGARAELAR